MKEEIWKSITGYEGLYEVSDLGTIRSLERWVTIPGQSAKRKCERILMRQSEVRGYRVVGLNKDAIQKQCKVHRLVATAFHQNPDNKPQVNHKNGVKNDNRAENLEWATNSENMVHALETGLIANIARGETHHGSKLNTKKVRLMRKLWADGTHTFSDLARMMGIQPASARNVVVGGGWAHVK